MAIISEIRTPIPNTTFVNGLIFKFLQSQEFARIVAKHLPMHHYDFMSSVFDIRPYLYRELGLISNEALAELGEADTLRREQVAAEALVDRAAKIALKHAIWRLNNRETVQHQTGWASVRYDSEQDAIVQARLDRVDSIQRRLWPTNIPLATELSNVQLHLRVATPDGLAHTDSHQYAVLFKASEDEAAASVYVPAEGGKLSADKDPLRPDTTQWREVEFMLGQLATAEYTDNPY